ncbi:6173_t:CDS:2 [Funneliformis caledonium]|uniref:6173_t:CDS:1 n=1 Tax=Funneliformis caledonium TaxID=1117310 RepID=A0A9N8ZKQ7_9GLOM|nr:6173_t:CDS:2 [Funneliformis caledonium]
MSIDLTFFNQIETNMEEESLRKDEIFRCVRNYEKTCRYITAILDRVHSASPEEVPRIIQTALEKYSEVKQHLAQLSQLVPYHQYYRYNDLWNRTLQTSLYQAELIIYLKFEKLISLEELEDLCGVEDILHSFIALTNELSRLAVNSVTSGDYNRPLRISKFVKELYTGFQLLNLKNDALRKRYDAIKPLVYNKNDDDNIPIEFTFNCNINENEMQ